MSDLAAGRGAAKANKTVVRRRLNLVGLVGSGDMEMQQIRYFRAMAELLNFTRAAERCGVSQPALTRSVQALEAEVGGPLFRRERSRTHLTELGRLIAPHLDAIAAHAEAVRTQSEAYANLRGGRLQVGILRSLSAEAVRPLLARFGDRHPTIEIVLRDRDAAELVNDLVTGVVDAAVVSSPEPLDGRLTSVQLFKEPVVVAVRPDHQLAGCESVTAGALQSHAYVQRSHCEHRHELHARLFSLGVALAPAVTVERDDLAVDAVRRGVGFAIAPQTCLDVPDVVLRPLSQPHMVRTVELATMRGRPHAPAVAALVRAAHGYASLERRTA